MWCSTYHSFSRSCPGLIYLQPKHLLQSSVRTIAIRSGTRSCHSVSFSDPRLIPRISEGGTFDSPIGPDCQRHDALETRLSHTHHPASAYPAANTFCDHVAGVDKAVLVAIKPLAQLEALTQDRGQRQRPCAALEFAASFKGPQRCLIPSHGGLLRIVGGKRLQTRVAEGFVEANGKTQ
jgi:hypothetical protein